jgi:hypothetical protein
MSNSSKEKLPRVSYNKEDCEFDIELWRDGWRSRVFPGHAPPTCLVVKDPKDIPAACSELHMVIPTDHTGTLYCLRFVNPEFGMGTTVCGLYLRSKAEAKCITEKLAEFEARDKK